MALSHRTDLNLFKCMRLELRFFLPYRIIQCKVWMDHISLSLVSHTSASNCKWSWEGKALFLLLLICLFFFLIKAFQSNCSSAWIFVVVQCLLAQICVEQWNTEEINKGKLAWVKRIIFALLSGSQWSPNCKKIICRQLIFL